MTKTSLGLEENVEAALSYVLGFLTGIVFYLLEKDSEFVRFHAMQSIVVFFSITIIQGVLMFIPFLGWILSWLLWIFSIALWIVLIIKAYNGEKFKIPFVGELSEKYI
ncbi:putative membrane protein [Geoglobus ahangari]|uniref:Putative membrane protein n=1 Tax=Geoglobus ahangari TaxID=113653 RepID=A0A0F7IFA5_9EURY|nr:DUF4870 domain-containing protein [Geoglobus ahangari]AKG91734.1 putative membrane protein [Geoglobus ahangari]